MFEPSEFRYPDACIVIFARAPEHGRVKTRLAAGIGADAALAVYRQLLEHTLKTVANSQLAPIALYLDGDMAHPYIQRMVKRTGAQLVAQQGNDLGERMFRALDETLQDRDYTLIIGTDCPAMDADYLECALKQLRSGAELVVGPSEDGGYVLIGATQADERVFRNISWGCDSVMQQTRDVMCRAGMRYSELEVLWDVDYPEDFRRWREASLMTT